ncbi:MAG: transporter substrate-binding domain-containing protein [Spirochaetaceae bacterium]|nr:transporter substrate-binding domain-containing protein [Spirochaetaceae bacterium]
MSNKKQIITIFLALLFLACTISGCSQSSKNKKTFFDINYIKSYRDIPGVTKEEIAAIEAIKYARSSFLYGSLISTESFLLPDGTRAGFKAMFCDLLSDLFDMPFNQESYSWDELKAGIDNWDIDFTSELTPLQERAQAYFMTHSIAERTLTVFIKDGAVKVDSERDLNGLKIGFYKGTITEQSLHNFYPALRFDAIDIYNAQEAVEKLKTEDIDAFIIDSVESMGFSSYDFITGIDVLPLVYTPVSMSTANPILVPIISVVNKYIEAGGIDNLYGLYKTGNHEYSKYELNKSFNEKEKEYLENLAAKGAKVPIALEFDNYPICFYNEREKEFQGIAVDILEEVSLLTGIKFDVVTGKNTPWSEIFEKLKKGDIFLVSDLRYSEERRDNFLWTDHPYAVTNYILMSKSNYPTLEIYQTVRATVGIARATVYDELFNNWFPSNTNVRYYDTHDEAMSALERDEIDLLMESEYGLLAQINLREKPGYKVNIQFKSPVSESFFGFNKNEEILRSIISKTQNHIGTDRIVRDWTTRSFDYSRKFDRERFIYMTVSSSVLMCFLVILIILFIKNNRTKVLYKTQATTLSTIYESIPDFIFNKNMNGVYVSCNDSFEKYIGRSKSEIIGKNPFDIYHDPKVAQGYSNEDKEVMERASILKLERWMTFPNGICKLFEVVKAPIFRGNKLMGMVGIGRDITEHRALLNELSKTHERTRIMLNTIPLCCFLANKKELIFDCNSEALRLFDLKGKQDFIDRFFDLSPEYQPDGRLSREAAMEYIQKAIDEGRYVFEWMHQLFDGTPIPGIVTLVRVNYENDYAILGYIRDMREHNKMMSEIESQNNLLKTVNSVSAILLDPDIEKFESNLLDSMSIIAKAIDVDRVCIWRNYTKDNQLYCTLTYEWLGDAIPQHKKSDLFTDISYDEVIPGWEKKLSQGKCINSLVYNMLFETQAQLSQWGILSVFVVPVFIHDTFWGFVGFDDCHREREFAENEELILRSASRMIANALIRNEMTQNIRNTAVKMEEAVKKANEASVAKSNFLAKMSHEIRTPMNAVIGMAELALREKELDVARRHIFTIKQAGANLLAIINDILDFTKIESGRLEIIPDYYHFSSLLNDVISIIRMRAIDSQLRFVVNIDSNIPTELYGDEARIRQILINILGNAVKYTEEGFISFTIIGKMANENTINLFIDVMDSGKGIKKEDMNKLFGDFVKLDTANNKNIEGTGLGLAITWNILKAMGGDIQVFSEYGKGSTFSITLPQRFRSRDKLAVVENPEEKSVIVFERRDIYANSIVATVDNLGVKCDIASDEAEFKKKLSGASKAFSFIFIASKLYEWSNSIITEFGASSKIVLLTEFGEAIPSTGWSTLAMPAHSISVANILNGLSDVYSYKEEKGLLVSFTAPDAKVLVVDDIKTNLIVTEGLLLPYKMQVDLRKSGMEAIRAVQAARYDLVFMDHWMPEMDGVEATRRIRNLDDEDGYYKNLPIIALTANAISGTKDMFLEKGLNGFLAKPIDTIKLNNVLGKWIPREKRKSPTSSPEGADSVASEENKQEAPTMEAIKIEGLDVKKAIALTGASIDRYMETLKVFYEDGIEKIKEIKTCLETGNIPLYAIHVHALKSAAANIGAEKLSNDARDLETAGKQEDMNFIETHTAKFLADMEVLLKDISNNLSMLRKNGKEKKQSIEKDELKAIFVKLKAAIEIMDAHEIDTTLALLSNLKLSDNINTGVQSISRHILMAEYDEASNLVETLLLEFK